MSLEDRDALKHWFDHGGEHQMKVALDMMSEAGKLDSREQALPQVDALMGAGWLMVIPEQRDSEPWQWYWRRPPRRKGSKGRLFLSTNQAFMALQREAADKSPSH